MGSIRVVYDTNVLVSGIGFGGVPWRCLLHAFVGDVELLTSDPLLDEFQRVLAYEHLPFTATEQQRFPELIRTESAVVDPDLDLQVVSDPDDNKFLECAIAGEASVVVSGDQHLLELDSFRTVTILEPAAFLETVESP